MYIYSLCFIVSSFFDTKLHFVEFGSCWAWLRLRVLMCRETTRTTMGSITTVRTQNFPKN